MRDLILWGATGQAKVLRELIHTSDLRLVALIDNRKIPSPFSDVPLLFGEEDLGKWLFERGGTENLFGAAAVGGGRGRERLQLMDILKNHGIGIETFIHRTAFVSYNAMLGEGCQVLAQTAVCAEVRLGRGVIINTSASVDHDCLIGDGVHIGPGAKLAGEVTVGEAVFIGTGAVVLPRLIIGNGSVVGAGAVVTKNVPAGVVVVGNPARLKTQGKDHRR